MPRTWLDLPDDHPFGLANLPYGVFATPGTRPRVGVRVGDVVLDLAAIAASGVGPRTEEDHNLVAAWRAPNLNPFLAMGRPTWQAARRWLSAILADPAAHAHVEPHLVALADATMHLPIDVKDYVDFYANEHHATNLGRLFRPNAEPLTPNWKHVPIGYHGRSGTVVVSGTDIIRPVGQRKAPGEPAPVCGPSARLDIETELGFVVGGATRIGERVGVDDADEHLFGVVLLNDWSARDIQAWEYVPLGPFLGKSFATSISSWVVTTEALTAARIPGPVQEPEPLPYLRGARSAYGLDIHCSVEVNGSIVARPEYRDMYWSPAQMLAHMTVNGASLRAGDLFGSGTISGPRKENRGSLLELSWNGTEPIPLADGTSRAFLADGDTVTLRAWATGPAKSRIGFGEVTATIRPSH